MGDEKENVRTFYEKVGWRKCDGLYEDTRLFEDVRDVTREYRQQCNARIGTHLPAAGSYLLDVASGPVAFDDYALLSRHFERHVCADISRAALMLARERLGDKGLYVVCDVAALPFRPRAVEAVVSLHTIYHVKADQQKQAILELYRVLKSPGAAVMVYTWDDPMLMKILLYPFRKMRQLAARARSLRGRSVGQTAGREQREKENLYSHTFDLRWFEQEIAAMVPLRLAVWRSVSVEFMKIFIHGNMAGRIILGAIYHFEQQWPAFFGRHGNYPMFIISKAAGDGAHD
jgi:ubiquinone/menaquinone biosynthesis C-methylase UbiE